MLVAVTLVVGGLGTAASAADRARADVRSLAGAESSVLGLLEHYKATAAWRSAFDVAVSRQAADLAELKSALATPGVRPPSARVTVPNLVNVELDRAEAQLGALGLAYKAVGGGIFGIVLPADWTVCSQHPAAGTRVARGSSVELDVEKYHCS
jgi:hypothetical protein